MLQSLGSQRVRHNLVTEQQQQQCPVLELLCPVNLWVSDYSLKYSMESFRDIRRMVTKCLLLISICLKSTMIKNKQYRESNTEHTEVAQSCLTLCDPMDCSHQASRSMGFSRHEYWSGLPFPSPRESNTLRQFILFHGLGDLWRKSCSLWLPPAPLVID